MDEANETSEDDDGIDEFRSELRSMASIPADLGVVDDDIDAFVEEEEVEDVDDDDDDDDDMELLATFTF